MPVELKEIIPWGRTLREYELMFSLTENELPLKILGCGDGPASFNAEWTARGGTVISIDPVYQFSGAEIKQRFDTVRDDIIANVDETPERWSWSFHRDSRDLLANRETALNKFLFDYAGGRRNGRYRIQELPVLDFKNFEFDLALCSHLLFLYSNLLSFDFHLASLIELCRVAREVRVFPLLNLAGKTSRHLIAVQQALENNGIAGTIETVPYEFQKGGNQMLRLRSTNTE